MSGVSVLLRTFNAGPRFDGVLSAVCGQSQPPREIIVVDSGSTDGTPDRARERGAMIVPLERSRFSHARSTNAGFGAATGDLVVSLSQDATPAGRNWLELLVRAMEPPGTAAAFGRQLPRPGCFYVERMELARGYPATAGEGRVLFSNVNSIVRRELWLAHPFDESLAIAEDQEWAVWAAGRGYEIAYVPGATVWHSHDYTLRQFYRRCFDEGRALSLFRHYRPGLKSIVVGWPRLVAGDFRALAAWGEVAQWPKVCLYRLAQLVGSFHGSRRAP